MGAMKKLYYEKQLAAPARDPEMDRVLGHLRVFAAEAKHAEKAKRAEDAPFALLPG